MTTRDSSRRSSQRKKVRTTSRIYGRKRKLLEESDSDAMDDFDVPDICLGGGKS